MKRLVEIEPFDLGLLHFDSTAKVWKEVDSTSAVKFTNRSFKLGDKIYVDLEFHKDEMKNQLNKLYGR